MFHVSPHERRPQSPAFGNARQIEPDRETRAPGQGPRALRFRLFLALLAVGCHPDDGRQTQVGSVHQAQVTSNYYSFVADTVLGALAPATRTGDLATKAPADLGVPNNTNTYQTIIFVKGSTSPGDGRGGNFYWDAGTCTDDGADTIVPHNPPVSIGSTGPCWRRQATERRGQMNAGVFHLKDYVNPASCDSSGSNCDLKPAFDEAMAECNALRTAQGDTAGFKGCVLLVPEGTHRLSGTVELCRSYVIRGEGLWRQSLTTIIADHSAFYMRGFQYCQDSSTNHGQGGRSLISGLQIAGSNDQTNPGGVNYNEGTIGIRMEDGGMVENVSVSGFVIGIRIKGFHQALGTNANVWALTNVDASENRFAGIYVNGADGNAGTAAHVMANTNCKRGNYWKDQMIGGDPAVGWGCAGVIDSSQLGNAWIGVHTMDTADTTMTPPRPYQGYYFAGGADTANVCLGCYMEGGQLPGHMDSATNIFGGNSQWEGGGFALQGGVVSKLVIRNYSDPKYRLELTFGNEPGVAFRVWRYAGTCSQSSSNAGTDCSADSQCTGGGSCQGIGTLKSEVSLQYDSYIKGYGFHINNLQSSNFGVMNFLAEDGTSYPGLSDLQKNKLHLQPTFLANCGFSSICGAP
jgi:hypothetical protein